MLLLDEPFSNLDTNLRVEVRTEVRGLLAKLGITSIFVTHDQDEAFIVGDRVAVMREGQIVQADSPQTLYHQPADRWTAEFVGTMSVIPGDANSGFVDCVLGSLPTDPELNGLVDVILRPEQLSIEAGGEAEVQLVEYYGHDSMVFVNLGDQQLRVRCGASTNLTRGDRVQVAFIGEQVLAFGRLGSVNFAINGGHDVAQVSAEFDEAFPCGAKVIANRNFSITESFCQQIECEHLRIIEIMNDFSAVSGIE